MLLNCYNSTERVEQFSLYEVSEGEEYQRKLHPDDSPLRVTQRWTCADRHLRIRRNPDYDPHRRKVRFCTKLEFIDKVIPYFSHSNCNTFIEHVGFGFHDVKITHPRCTFMQSYEQL